MITILVTGGCGFIGSNFIRYVLAKRGESRIVNLDKLTYAGNPANLADILQEYAPSRYRFIKGDIRDKKLVEDIFRESGIDWVVNFAAESHVDRSIVDPADFLHTNILGTFTLLEAAKEFWLDAATDVDKKRFLHVSTDEVYGSLSDTGLFSEATPYDPSSPYSASKAASDHLAVAYYRTYSLPVIITNCSNNYGPYQFPEKLIPLTISNAIKGRTLPVYGDGKNVRDWLYVEDHCEAILATLENGRLGEKYNIGGNCEKQNIEVVTLICDYLDKRLGLIDEKPRTKLIAYVPDRLGHDRRYAIDASKIRDEILWEPSMTFENGIAKTIEWYLDNQVWVEDIETGRYRELYRGE
ncbi:MAG: dTDP-glucose 4,6-dehydratase [Deltaproteobacteria bacterium]|nr:MAG: dTDP-glucose 4,6-dehydratase [Deltaproteobacteria bacterium]